MQRNGDYGSPPQVQEMGATEQAGKPESLRARNYKEHTYRERRQDYFLTSNKG